MDRFDAMQAFARVVEAGSFTKAADTLRLNKTSVTQLIQQLEAHLRGADFLPGRSQHGLHFKSLAVVVDKTLIHIGVQPVLQGVVLGMDVPCCDLPLTCPLERLCLQSRRRKKRRSRSDRQKAVFEFHGTLLNKSFTMQ